MMAVWLMFILWLTGIGFWTLLNLITNTFWRAVPLDGKFSVWSLIIGLVVHVIVALIFGVADRAGGLVAAGVAHPDHRQRGADRAGHLGGHAVRHLAGGGPGGGPDHHAVGVRGRAPDLRGAGRRGGRHHHHRREGRRLHQADRGRAPRTRSVPGPGRRAACQPGHRAVPGPAGPALRDPGHRPRRGRGRGRRQPATAQAGPGKRGGAAPAAADRAQRRRPADGHLHQRRPRHGHRRTRRLRRHRERAEPAGDRPRRHLRVHRGHLRPGGPGDRRHLRRHQLRGVVRGRPAGRGGPARGAALLRDRHDPGPDPRDPARLPPGRRGPGRRAALPGPQPAG